MLSIITIFLFACNTEDSKKNENDNREVTNEKESVLKTYKIDTAESVLKWKGDMIGVYAHEGEMKFKNGTISIKGSEVVSGTFVVDMNSIVTTDDDELYKNSPREKLIAHLEADDFFAVDSFPTSSFVIESMKNNLMTGDLTIRGITHSVEVTDVNIIEKEETLSASGKLIFDRQKFNVSYESKMKDMVLSDDIELEINLTGNLKK